jgi:hypothetical protein
VEPTRSAKSTETTFRSSPRSPLASSSPVIGSVSEAPQVPQNRASTAFEAPQAEHRSPSAAPHDVQYRWSAAFIAEHDGQIDPATVRRV